MEIKWRESRNTENLKVVRASVTTGGYAIFSFAGELLNVGKGLGCETSDETLAQMISDSGAAIDAIVATQAPVARPKMSAYRNDYRYDAKTGYRGGSLTAEMDLEDSAF